METHKNKNHICKKFFLSGNSIKVYSILQNCNGQNGLWKKLAQNCSVLEKYDSRFWGTGPLWPPRTPSTCVVSTLLWMQGATWPLAPDCVFSLFVYACFNPNAFTHCLFAEPVSFRNHLLNWIYRWRWVDATNSWGSWAHFSKWTLLILNFLSLSQVQGCALFRI